MKDPTCSNLVLPLPPICTTSDGLHPLLQHHKLKRATTISLPPLVQKNHSVGKHGADLVSSPTMCAPASVPASAPTTATSSKNANAPPVDPNLQIHQLEQNIRFLKEQHQVMLGALHQEVESLRNRNRDLQFQLVSSRENSAVKSKSSSSEDLTKAKPVVNSQQTPPTPNRVEILEKDVADLRVSLSDARDKNAQLQTIIDEQQRKLAELSIKSVERSQPSERELILANQLQETERLLYRTRRAQDDLRREMSLMRESKYRNHAADATSENGRHHNQPQQDLQQQQPQQQPQRGSNPNRHHQHHHQSHQNHQQQQQHEPSHFPSDFQSEAGHSHGNRFPPLPVPNYWQNNGQSRWTAGGENSQRHPSGRPNVQSMPSLPEINLGNPQGENPRRTHYYRSGGSSRDGGHEGLRRYRGRNASNGSGRSHRTHGE